MNAFELALFSSLLVFVIGCVQTENVEYICSDGVRVAAPENCVKNPGAEGIPFPVQTSKFSFGNANGAYCGSLVENLEIKGNYLYLMNSTAKCEIRLKFTPPQWGSGIPSWPEMINPDYYIEFVNVSCKESVFPSSQGSFLAWERGKILKCETWVGV